MELIMYIEKISSRKTDCSKFQNAMKAAAKGDRFVVYKLDRLARSTKADLEAARKRGRPSIDEKTKCHIVTLFQEGESVADIAKEFSIARSTVYKILHVIVYQYIS